MAILDRDTLDGKYFTYAKREITKMIQEKDSGNRKNIVKEESQSTKEVEDRETKIKKKYVEDDWLDV